MSPLSLNMFFNIFMFPGILDKIITQVLVKLGTQYKLVDHEFTYYSPHSLTIIEIPILY